MTSLATAPAPVLVGVRTPFLRLVRVEIRKQLDTRASLWLLIAIALITLGAAALAMWVLPASELTWRSLTDFASAGWSMLLPIIGVLAATSEGTQRTGLQTFVLEPRRSLVNLAKLTASLLVGVVMVVTTFAASAAANLIAASALDGDGSWALEPDYLVGSLASMVIYVAMGVGLGLTLLNTPLAIVTFVVLPTVFGAIALVPWLADLIPWIDIVGAMTTLVGGAPSGEEWAQLATASAVWCVVPLAIGFWRTARRDVN
ncbi:ABC transporter permease [Microbacterium sp. G2-8]|uniref:ABC transporter permease n=1 Tax=Microbacterium sp. G2-8 TaxID=2842454 RepID=UPI001C89ADDB|nr:ABC transporter permease [Microbacterium sp. G2-8]